MPMCSDAFHEPTYSWINKVANRREIALLRDSVKRLEGASRQQLLLENESQDTFDFLYAESAHTKKALGALCKAVDGEIIALRDQIKAMGEEVITSRDRERAAAEAATQALTEVQRVMSELGSSSRLEAELKTTKEQLEELRKAHEELKVPSPTFLEPSSNLP